MPIVPLDPFDGEGIGITSAPWGVWLHSDGHGYIAVPAFSCTADGEADHGYGPTQAGRPVWAGVSEDWASDALRLRAERLQRLRPETRRPLVHLAGLVNSLGSPPRLAVTPGLWAIRAPPQTQSH